MLTDEYRGSIVARIIWTFPFTILHFRGVNSEHMVLTERTETYIHFQFELLLSHFWF